MGTVGSVPMQDPVVGYGVGYGTTWAEAERALLMSIKFKYGDEMGTPFTEVVGQDVWKYLTTPIEAVQSLAGA